MKIITGLFMAWGNFLSLPCPVKKWDNDLKNYMLGFLPTVGMIIGVLWAGLCVAMVWLGFPYLVLSFLVTFIPFALCGFLHLDGFMDCCDAMMSRKPLKEKQAILKDPHCGAFAAVSLVFMLLGCYSCISTAISTGIDFIDLCMIPIISRSIAGLNVLLRKPMDHSQYAEGAGADDKVQKRKAVIMILIQLIVYCTAGAFLSSYLLPSAIVVAVTAAATYLSAVIAKRRLGGMSGDIAGYAITWGEFFGIFAMLIL